jgi:hypothetical protein
LAKSASSLATRSSVARYCVQGKPTARLHRIMITPKRRMIDGREPHIVRSKCVAKRDRPMPAFLWRGGPVKVIQTREPTLQISQRKIVRKRLRVHSPPLRSHRGPIDPAHPRRSAPILKAKFRAPPRADIQRSTSRSLLPWCVTIRNFPARIELTIPVGGKHQRRFRCDLSSSEPVLQQASASSPQQLQQPRSARRLSARQKISSRRRNRAAIALGSGVHASSRMSAVKLAKATAGDTAKNAVAVIVRTVRK